MKNRFWPGTLAVASLLIFTGAISFAQEFQIQWAKAISGTTAVTAGHIAADNQGNVYVTGSLQGTVDFNPGSSNGSVTANGSSFIAKYDQDGNFLYVNLLNVLIADIAVDYSGHLYLVGTFRDTVDFDWGPGTAERVSAALRDLFVAKYDPQGNYVHAFSLEGTGSDRMQAIAIDANNNVYITGDIRGITDFDPGEGVLLVQRKCNNGGLFLAKYTENGNLSFAFDLDCSGNFSEGVSLAIEKEGNIHVGGRFFGTLDLDPGSNTNIFRSIGVDGFMAKYDSSGNHISGYVFDGSVWSVSLDELDNLLVAGLMPDSMDVDPGPGIFMLYSENNFDVWMAKYDSQGNLVHARAFESNANYQVFGVEANQLNHVYLYGTFRDTLNLNPGGLNGELYSSGNNDGYIGKFDPAGNSLFGAAFGSTFDDRISDLAIDRKGGLWISGYFQGTVDFDPGAAVSAISSLNSRGMFVVKYLDDAVTRISEFSGTQLDINIYSARQQAFIDFSTLNHVNAQVKIINLMGQVIAETNHTRSDLLKLDLSHVSGQVHLVVVNHDGNSIAKKIWVR